MREIVRTRIRIMKKTPFFFTKAQGKSEKFRQQKQWELLKKGQRLKKELKGVKMIALLIEKKIFSR